MAQIHGKQVKDESLLLNKLNTDGGQGDYSFGSGTMLQLVDAPTDGTDLANKDYVDSVAAGLDPKESVRLISNTNLSLSGSETIDNVVVADGDRILVNGQTDLTENGIYVVDTGGPWSRAEDADGTPSYEVSKGNFTFVESGDQFAGTGWVLSQTDASDPTQINVGTDTQLWTQFSTQGQITVGAGIDKDGNEISVELTTDGGITFSQSGVNGTLEVMTGNGIELVNGDISVNLAADSGLTFVSDELTIDENIAGTGLTWDSGVLNADADALLTENTLGFTASENSVQDVLTEIESQLNEVVTDVIGGDGLTSSEVNGVITIDVNAGTGIEIIGDDVTANSDALLTGNVLGFTASTDSIQTVLEEIENQLNAVTDSNRVEAQYVAGVNTTGNDDNTTIALGFTPYNGSVVELYVNGQKQQYGAGNDYYFSSDGTSGGARAIDEVEEGDFLVWNGDNSGFDLSTDDNLSIVSVELVS